MEVYIELIKKYPEILEVDDSDLRDYIDHQVSYGDWVTLPGESSEDKAKQFIRYKELAQVTEEPVAINTVAGNNVLLLLIHIDSTGVANPEVMKYGVKSNIGDYYCPEFNSCGPRPEDWVPLRRQINGELFQSGADVLDIEIKSKYPIGTSIVSVWGTKGTIKEVDRASVLIRYLCGNIYAFMDDYLVYCQTQDGDVFWAKIMS